MLKRIVLSSLLFLVFNSIIAQKNIFEIKTQTTQNKPFTISQLKDFKAVVFVFLSPECPLCHSYSALLNDLASKYKASNIEFVGIFSGVNYSNDEINKYLKEYSITFPTIIDKEYRFKYELNAKVTPEVFLVSKNNAEILYYGRIDNWAYALGKHRMKASEHNLKQSIELFLSNKPITNKYRNAIGCIIE
jgi:thiol-disulfide isomerase/thioredoxin